MAVTLGSTVDTIHDSRQDTGLKTGTKQDHVEDDEILGWVGDVLREDHAQQG